MAGKPTLRPKVPVLELVAACDAEKRRKAQGVPPWAGASVSASAGLKLSHQTQIRPAWPFEHPVHLRLAFTRWPGQACEGRCAGGPYQPEIGERSGSIRPWPSRRATPRDAEPQWAGRGACAGRRVGATSL